MTVGRAGSPATRTRGGDVERLPRGVWFFWLLLLSAAGVMIVLLVADRPASADPGIPVPGGAVSTRDMVGLGAPVQAPLATAVRSREAKPPVRSTVAAATATVERASRVAGATTAPAAGAVDPTARPVVEVAAQAAGRPTPVTSPVTSPVTGAAEPLSGPLSRAVPAPLAGSVSGALPGSVSGALPGSLAGPLGALTGPLADTVGAAPVDSTGPALAPQQTLVTVEESARSGVDAGLPGAAPARPFGSMTLSVSVDTPGASGARGDRAGSVSQPPGQPPAVPTPAPAPAPAPGSASAAVRSGAGGEPGGGVLAALPPDRTGSSDRGGSSLALAAGAASADPTAIPTPPA